MMLTGKDADGEHSRSELVRPWRGLGVVGREGMGVTDLERVSFSLASGEK